MSNTEKEKGKMKQAACAMCSQGVRMRSIYLTPWCSIVIKAVGTTTSNFQRHVEKKHPKE